MNRISVQTPKSAVSWRLLEFKLQSGISVCHGSHLQCLVFWLCWRTCMIADGYSFSGSYPCDGCNQHGLISGPLMVPCQYWIFICVFSGGFALFVGVMLWFTVGNKCTLLKNVIPTLVTSWSRAAFRVLLMLFVYLVLQARWYPMGWRYGCSCHSVFIILRSFWCMNLRLPCWILKISVFCRCRSISLHWRKEACLCFVSFFWSHCIAFLNVFYSWSSGTFKLTLQFTEDYPNKPPTVRFVSKMFHPNSKSLSFFFGGFVWLSWCMKQVLSFEQ